MNGIMPSKVKNNYPLGLYRLFKSNSLDMVKLEEFLKVSYDVKLFIESNNRIPVLKLTAQK